ncbi:MAG: ABC transporter ATP-binding protein [bacterium]
MSSIRCVELCKYFHQGEEVIRALDHVSLEIDAGEFLCISGPSGSGKTTLLNAVGGLDKIDSGEVYIDGERVDQLDKGAMADMRLHNIGFVFQAYNLIPVLTARENVEFVMQIQGMAANVRRDKAIAILQEVGLQGMEDRLPAELSGGQQQRVAVARAIVSEPRLVLADEPTANLDSATADHLMGLFRKLNQHHNATFLISTHDPRVMKYANRLIKMQDGKIIADERQAGA